VEASALVTVRPLDVVEGPAKLFDLRAEPIAFGSVLLALGSEAVALAAEDLDVLRLYSCRMELLLKAGMLVTVRPFDVVEGPAKLLDLRAEPIAFGSMLFALGPKPVALAAEGLDVLARLLLCLLDLLLEAGVLITMRPLDVVEGPTKLLELAAEPIAFGPMLLALSTEPVALAAEDLDVVGLLSCLLEAGEFIAMRLFGVIEGPAEGVAI
jgi:hypothetical protein